ncbi:MAG TPA: hypothetical protein VJO35_02810 [Terriglobales bacterium]|nr:hypothetical protein [Terriglobales bacterium]
MGIRARRKAVTESQIDTHREELSALTELTMKLSQELSEYGIGLAPTHAFSTASVGKAYLRAMGVEPILQRQPSFPNQYLGHAQTAFFGGRTGVHIRKTICPVVCVDFLSMYSTINCLMCIWRLVIAQELRVLARRKKKVERFLRTLTPEALFKPKTWKQMTGFAKVIPNGDILPIRSRYGAASNDWQVGINRVYAKDGDALWFSVPDLVASVLLTGQIPEIVDAFFIRGFGTTAKLAPTRLLGLVDVDPKHDDFFRVIVDQRLRLASRSDLTAVQRKRLEKALKILASATGYGIWAQMDRLEGDEKVEITCHGIDSEAFTCKVSNPDAPGEFCFPLLAALITGGARLMLALVEHCVTELGGEYVMEDTDSMTVVATEHGGLVPCPGGPFELSDGRRAVRALSWTQVDEIAAQFRKLSPYRQKSRSILKIEIDNYDLTTGEQRQVYCFAISSKRYALFLLDENGEPALLQKGVNNPEDRWSEHGLGHLRNPLDFESEDRGWIHTAWLNIVRRALGLPIEPLSFEHFPAVGRITITSPKVLRAVGKMNRGKTYKDRLKPFNFLLSCHVRQFGYPFGVDPEKFHLVAPYQPNPRRWVKMPWINQYTGEEYRITTRGFHGGRGKARVKTYGDVLREYEFHPGSKNADAFGNPSGKQTIGLLRRRHIRVGQISYIGRESNRLEEVEAGIIHLAQSVYTDYPDPRREEWQTKVLPALRKFPVRVLARLTNISRSTLTRTLAGTSRPRLQNRILLASALRKIGAL